MKKLFFLSPLLLATNLLASGGYITVEAAKFDLSTGSQLIQELGGESLDDPWGISVRLGAEFPGVKGTRLELQYLGAKTDAGISGNVSAADAALISGIIGPGFINAGDPASITTDYKINGLMANFKYGFMPIDRLAIGLLAGAGAVKVDLDVKGQLNNVPYSFSDSDLNFAWQGGAYASYDLTSYLRIDASVNYIDMGSVSFFGNGLTASPSAVYFTIGGSILF